MASQKDAFPDLVGDHCDVLLSLLADFVLDTLFALLLEHFQQRFEDLFVVALDDAHRKLVDCHIRAEFVHRHVLVLVELDLER
jgi:hypothetical protein